MSNKGYLAFVPFLLFFLFRQVEEMEQRLNEQQRLNKQKEETEQKLNK